MNAFIGGRLTWFRSSGSAADAMAALELSISLFDRFLYFDSAFTPTNRRFPIRGNFKTVTYIIALTYLI
jgi:hypothetical protein